jgi:hypothetical protein
MEDIAIELDVSQQHRERLWSSPACIDPQPTLF